MALVTINGELYHYGVKGMKWGRRRALKKTAKNRYKRSVNSAFSTYEKEINSIEKNYKRGQNLSKKDLAREAAAEARYQQAAATAKSKYKQAKKNIDAQLKKEASVDRRSDDAKNAAKIKTKKVSEMSNQELRTLNERTRLEQEYSRLNPNLVKKGAKMVATTTLATTTVLTLYNNSDKLIKLGNKLVKKYTD